MIFAAYLIVGILVALFSYPFLVIWERKDGGYASDPEAEAAGDSAMAGLVWPLVVVATILWLIGRFVLAPIYRPIIKKLDR